jgi:DnaK suppressor protein
MPKSIAKPSKSKRPASKPLSKPSNKKSPKQGGKYDEIRKDLDQQRVELLQEAGAALTNRPEFAAFPDLSDQATAEVDSNFELRLKEREQKLLKKIDEALDRIATNTYGICERCGEEIPYKRLKARPVTTLCIECKTQQEEEEKIRA